MKPMEKKYLKEEGGRRKEEGGRRRGIIMISKPICWSEAWEKKYRVTLRDVGVRHNSV